uniref:Uncharacterized protein n=1 Tax=Plectus sambesii TaxID=2011161 RepID=A0A914WXE7_9BILA
MIRLLVLLVACSSVAWAEQNCHTCTSATSLDILNGWNWGPQLNSNPPNINFKQTNCDLAPLVASGSAECATLCFKWQYNYTDATGKAAYETIRGCASDIPNLYIPSSDNCTSYFQPSPGGQGNPGGINAGPGKYSMCYCTGDFCNPASKMTAFSLGASLFIALFIIFYQN